MTAGLKKNGDENAASLGAAMVIEEYVHGTRLGRDDALDTEATVQVWTGGRSNESTSQRVNVMRATNGSHARTAI